MAVAVTNLTGSSGLLVDANDRTLNYFGFSVREPTGISRALITLLDSADGQPGGRILEELALAPGESRAEYYSQPIVCKWGVWVQVNSGTIVGSVRTHG